MLPLNGGALNPATANSFSPMRDLLLHHYMANSLTLGQPIGNKAGVSALVADKRLKEKNNKSPEPTKAHKDAAHTSITRGHARWWCWCAVLVIKVVHSDPPAAGLTLCL